MPGPAHPTPAEQLGQNLTRTITKNIVGFVYETFGGFGATRLILARLSHMCGKWENSYMDLIEVLDDFLRKSFLTSFSFIIITSSRECSRTHFK